MAYDPLLSALEGMTLGYSSNYDNDGTLTTLVRLLGIKPKTKSKANTVDALYRFYSDQGSIATLYKKLSKYEKELLTCIVQSDYWPLEEDIEQIAEAYGTKKNMSYYYSFDYKTKYFPKGSPLFALFVNGSVPDGFKAYLDTVTPLYVRKFSPCTVDDEEYAPVIGRESRYRDFDMLLSFVNTQKVAATKSGGYMSKSSLLKFNSNAGYVDICNSDSGEIHDIRNAGEAITSYGMVQLMRAACVIDIVQGKYVLSTKASHYAALTMPEKAKFLFEAYMNNRNGIIDECARISASKLRFSRSSYNLTGPRQAVVDYLKECPLNQWVGFYQFSKELRKADRDLFDVVGDVLIRDDYNNSYYQSAGWNDFEYCAMSVMLIEYLATLGAVDILAQEDSHSDYDYGASAYEATYFRVTDLGQFLFGMADAYVEKGMDANSQGASGFVVQPNFDVVIPNSPERMRHELFFERFASKVVDDQEVSVYKLDFKGMVNALNIGLYIREISSYCENFSSVPVPDNIKTAFAEWEAQSSRIRIRNVSIIEADDVYLLEELKNYRGMAALSEGELKSVLILAQNSEKKAKALIEKNNRFCVMSLK